MSEISQLIQRIDNNVGPRLANLEKAQNAIETALALSQAPGGGGGARKVIKSAFQGRTYRDLFGDVTSGEWKNEKEFYDAVCSGKYHPKLDIQDSINEGTSSDGGALVPTEYSQNVHDAALENEIILPRCSIETMTSNTKKIPATEIGDHSANLYGGIVGFWTAEAGSLTEANPKFREMTLNAKKLTVLFKFSNEWKEDVQNSENKLSALASAGLGWFRDRAYLKLIFYSA